MAMIDFDTLLDCLQSPYSLPEELLTSQEGLHFRDIHFALLQHTLNMQHISLIYLKSLNSDNCFQPEGTSSDVESSSTAILIVFLSDAKHTTIQHVHLGLVVCWVSCNLRILPFIMSIEEVLEGARQRCNMGKNPGGVHSYAMLVANFSHIMAILTDPPYCLVYPIVYNDNIAAQNQNHFNTVGSPSGLRTHDLMCRTLLQHADLTEAHKWKYEGSCLIVPHGKDLPRLKRKGYQVSTFKEEKPPSSSYKKENNLLPALWEMCQVPLVRRGSLPRPAASPLGLPHPGPLLIPPAARNRHLASCPRAK